MVNKPDSFRGEKKKELLADNREDSYDKGQPADTKEHLRTNEVGDSGNPAALATSVEAPVAMDDKGEEGLGDPGGIETEPEVVSVKEGGMKKAARII